MSFKKRTPKNLMIRSSYNKFICAHQSTHKKITNTGKIFQNSLCIVYTVDKSSCYTEWDHMEMPKNNQPPWADWIYSSTQIHSQCVWASIYQIYVSYWIKKLLLIPNCWIVDYAYSHVSSYFDKILIILVGILFTHLNTLIDVIFYTLKFYWIDQLHFVVLFFRPLFWTQLHRGWMVWREQRRLWLFV